MLSRNLLLALLVVACAGIMASKTLVWSGNIFMKSIKMRLEPPQQLTYDNLYPIPPVNQRIRTNTMILRPDWRWTTKFYPQYSYPRGGGNESPTCWKVPRSLWYEIRSDGSKLCGNFSTGRSNFNGTRPKLAGKWCRLWWRSSFEKLPSQKTM